MYFQNTKMSLKIWMSNFLTQILPKLVSYS